MFTRLLRAARYFNPQTWRGTVVRVDQLADSTHRLRAQVDELLVRTEQLETAARLDWEMQDELARLDAQLDRARIETHVSRAVAKAQLDTSPFPHIVVDNWLPSDVYQLMLAALPPAVFFADRDVSRQRMVVPFGKGPIYSRRVWDFISRHIVGEMLHDALALKFDSVIQDFIKSACGELEGLDWQMHTSDGRIMLRRPGYVIAPHRDPKWGFVTGLIYLANPVTTRASARSSIGCAATKRRLTTSRTTWTSRGATWCGPCHSRPIRCWRFSIPPARTVRPFPRMPVPPIWSGMCTSSGSDPTGRASSRCSRR